MPTPTRTYKTSKVKSFLFFLLLAMIFWILAKFSKETTALVYANVGFDNAPENISVASSSSEKLSFELTTNGFEALSYKFNEPSIVIDVSRFYKEGDSVIVLENADLIKLISSQLDNASGINNLSQNSWTVFLDRLETRKVPVQLVTEINYKEGYRNLGPIAIQPDSVTIVGPLQKIKGIMAINTEKIEEKNASDRIERKIKLQLPDDAEISVKTTEVDVLIEVEEFTQKQFLVPISLINAPLDTEVKLLPNEIMVTFDVAMSQFNAISPSDFKLVCDYRERNEDESYLWPVMERYPEDLYNMELATKRVEYLIFK